MQFSPARCELRVIDGRHYGTTLIDANTGTSHRADYERLLPNDACVLNSNKMVGASNSETRAYQQ